MRDETNARRPLDYQRHSPRHYLIDRALAAGLVNGSGGPNINRISKLTGSLNLGPAVAWHTVQAVLKGGRGVEDASIDMVELAIESAEQVNG